MKNHSKLIFLVTFFIVLWAHESLSASFTMSFAQFKALYGKSYSTATEEAVAKAIFTKNTNHIKKYNNWAKKYKLSSRLGVNANADSISSGGQFSSSKSAITKSLKVDASINPVTSSKVKSKTTLPATFDWRLQGTYITDVQDQGDCKADWAFAAKSVLESRYAIQKDVSLVPFSAQQGFTCSTGTQFCGGGSASKAMLYALINGALDEAYNAFNGSSTTCNTTKTNYRPLTVYYYPKQVTNQIKKDIMTRGPIVASILSSYDILFYKAGLYVDSNCQDPINTFFFTLVGWTVTSDKVEYWLAKGSMGISWGNSGYLKLPIKSNFKYCDNTMQIFGSKFVA